MREMKDEEIQVVSGGLDLGSVLTSVAICAALYYYRDAVSATVSGIVNRPNAPISQQNP